jgi:hypothetical protein
MARKSAQKSKGGSWMLPVMHPDAAGVDIGAEEIFVAVPADRAADPVRSFGTFTRELHELADWLQKCGVRTVAMESTGVFWIMRLASLCNGRVKSSRETVAKSLEGDYREERDTHTRTQHIKGCSSGVGFSSSIAQLSTSEFTGTDSRKILRLPTTSFLKAYGSTIAIDGGFQYGLTSHRMAALTSNQGRNDCNRTLAPAKEKWGAWRLSLFLSSWINSSSTMVLLRRRPRLTHWS